MADGATGGFIIRAEDIIHSGYQTENVGVAEDGKLASLFPGQASQGELRYTHTGEAGLFDLILTVFDEADGQGSFDVLVNGELVFTYQLDQLLGSNWVDNGNRVNVQIEGLELSPGDVVSIVGYADAGEWVRIDTLEFTPVGPPPPPPEPAPPTGDLDDVNVALDADFVINLDEHFSDINGDALTYQISGPGAAYAQLDGSTLTINASVEGDFGLTVIANDGTFDSAPVAFTFSATETPPEPISIEAETIIASGFVVENHGATSQGQVASLLNSGNSQGELSYTFEGGASAYDLSIIAHDENDGVSTVEVLVDGVLVETFTLDGDFPSGAIADNNRVSLDVTGLNLAPGAVITIRAQQGQGEWVRIDKLEFTPVGPINEAPVGTPSPAIAATEDVVTTFNEAELLANFTDPEGDAMTVDTLSTDVGQLAPVGNGDWTLTAPADFNGQITLTYGVSDGQGNVTPASRIVEVAAVNDAPTTSPIDAGAAYDDAAPVPINLLDGAGDAENDVLSAINITVLDDLGASAAFTDNGDGTITIDPTQYAGLAADQSRTLTISYDVFDGTDATANTATLEIDAAAGINRAPVGTPAPAIAASEDLVTTISEADLLANFTDPEGDAMTVESLATDIGQLTPIGNGDWALTTPANFNGPVTLTYGVSDGQGNVTPASRTVDVAAVNDAPTGALSDVDVTVDTPLVIDLDAAFSDVESDALTYQISGPGAAYASLDGSTLTINASVEGAFGITVIANDGTFDSAPVAFTVRAADVPPAPVLIEAEDIISSGFVVENSGVASQGQVASLLNSGNSQGELAYTFEAGAGTYDLSIITHDENDGVSTVEVLVDGVLVETFTLDGGFPSGAIADNNRVSLDVTGLNLAPGAEVVVRAQQGGGEWVRIDTLEFTPVGPPPEPAPPTGDLADVNVALDAPFIIDLDEHFSDINGDALTYQISGPGAAYAQLDGSTLTINASVEGDFGLTVIANDGTFDSAPVAFTFSATETPPEPISIEAETIIASGFVVENHGATSQGQVASLLNSGNSQGELSYTFEGGASAYDLSIIAHDENDGVSTVEVLVDGVLVETFTLDGDFPSGAIADNNRVSLDVTGLNLAPGAVITIRAQQGQGEWVRIDKLEFTPVGPINEAPVGTPSPAIAATEDVVTTFNEAELLANFTDPEGDAMTVDTLSTDVGQLAPIGNGDWTLTAPADFNGQITLTYGVNDGQGNVTPASRIVEVAAVNDAPTTSPVDAGAAYDDAAPVPINLLDGASDAENDVLSAINITVLDDLGASAAFTDNGDGTITIDPTQYAGLAADQSRTLTISYDVFDGTDATANTATLEIDAAAGINRAPVGTPAPAIAASEDLVTTISEADLLANFTDPDGDAMTVESLATDVGQLTPIGNGDWALTTPANFNGPVTLTYGVSDGQGNVTPTSRTVDVAAVNDAPTGALGDVDVTVDTPLVIDLDAAFSDVESDALTYQISGPGAAYAQLDGSTLTINASVEGDFGLTVIANDGTFDSAPVAFTFSATETPPEPISIEAETIIASGFVVENHGATSQGQVASLLNSGNSQGELSYTFEGGASAYDLSIIAHDENDGVSTVEVLVDGVLVETFTLDGDFPSGAIADNNRVSLDVTGLNLAPGAVITIRAQQGQGEWVRIDKLEFTPVGPINEAPVGTPSPAIAATEDVVTTFNEAELLANFTDPEGDAMTVDTLSTDVGQLAPVGNGDWTLTAPADFNGQITLTYGVSDGQGNVTPASRIVEVAAVNDAPTTSPIDAGAAYDDAAPVPINLLDGASDAENDVLSAINITVLDDLGASAAFTDNGDGTITIDPTQYAGLAADQSRTLTISYDVFDGTDATANTATLEIDAAAGINRAPVGTPAPAIAASEDLVTTISEADLLANFTDPDGDAMTVESLATDVGQLTPIGNGDWALTTPANFNGPVTLTYGVSDGQGNVTPTSRTVDVAAVNDAPTGALGDVDVTVDTPLVIDLDAAFSDVESDALTYQISGPGAAYASLDGSTLTINASVEGAFGITVIANDGTFDSAPVAFTVSATEIPVDTVPSVVLFADELNLTIGARPFETGAGTTTGLSQDGEPALGEASFGVTPAAYQEAGIRYGRAIDEKTGVLHLDIYRPEGSGGDLAIRYSVTNDDGTTSNFTIRLRDDNYGLWTVEGVDTPVRLRDLPADQWHHVTADLTALIGDGATLSSIAVRGDGDGGDTYYLDNVQLTETTAYSEPVHTEIFVSPLWSSAPGAFIRPESAQYDPVTGYVFVSEALPDGQGKVMLLDTDGNIVDPDWLTGLTWPKGLIIENGLVYVATDKDLVVANVATGEVVASYTADAGASLNDVTMAADGSVYVSDLNQAAIWRLKDGVFEMFVSDPTLVSANGIRINDDKLWLATFDQGVLYEIDLETKAISQVLDGVQAFDGVIEIEPGIWLMSSFNGQIRMYNEEDGSLTSIYSNLFNHNAADIGYDPASQTIFVPTFSQQGVFALQLHFPEGAGTPTPVPSDPIEVEAETIIASGFIVEGQGVASNDEVASLFRSGATEGELSYTFAGGAATYDLSVIAHDETDGVSTVEVLVNGEVVETFTLDASLGSNSVADNNRVSLDVAGLALEAGDEVVIRAQQGGGEWVRVDKLVFTPVGGAPTPAPTPNQAPVGTPAQAVAGVEDMVTTITMAELLSNFTDPDGDAMTVEALSTDTGQLISLGNGAWALSTPADFNGPVTLTFNVDDGNGGVTPTTRTVDIAPVNDAPTGAATAVLADGTEGVAYVVSAADLLAGFSDVDADVLSVANLTADNEVQVTDNTDGTFTLTPPAGFNGAVVLTYDVTDGELTAPATQSVTFAATNDAPVSTADAYSTDEDTALVVPAVGVLTNDSDADDDSLTAVLVSDVANGALTLNDDGSFTYTPNADFTGADSFTYKANDGTADGNTVTVDITVNAVNDAPVAGDALTNQTADEGSAFAYSLPVDAFSDVDGDELTLAATLDDDTELPNWLMFDPDTGAFSGTPGQDDVGELTVKVTATDPSGETAVQIFTLTIGATNNAPVVSAIDAGAVAENAEAQTIDLLAGQTDPENDTLSAINITVVDENNAPVQFTDKGDGAITIDPAQFADALNDGDTRNVTVSYDVSDGTNTTPNTATLDVTGADAPNTAPVAVNDVLGDESDPVSEFLVNELTNVDQRDPKITALAGGGFVMTWVSTDPREGDTSFSGIKARIFNADGTEAVSEFLVNEFTNDNQLYPAITALAGGGFVVTWESNDPLQGDNSATGIKARIFNADGTEAVSEFLVNEFTNEKQQFPAITALKGGGFVVAWSSEDKQQGDTSSTSIKARIFNADGTEAVSEFLVNEFTFSYQFRPSITTLKGGGFVVTWESNDRQQGDTSLSSINARIFNADGTEAASEFLVNELTNDYQLYPAITALAGGGFVVTWQSSDPQQGDTSNTGIKARIFNADGTEAVSEFLVNEFTNDSQYIPRITALAGGGFVVTWYSYDLQQGDDSTTGIKARIFNADGTEAVSEFLVNELTISFQQAPSITALEGGGFVVTWQSIDGQQGDTSGLGVKARIFNADGTPRDVSSAATNEDTALTIQAATLLANDTDADGDDLTITDVDATSANGAIVTLNSDGTISYDPTNAAAIQTLALSDRLEDSFTYSISDGNGGTSSATATVTVQGANDPPIVGVVINNQSADEDSEFSYAVPAGAFHSIYGDDDLTLTARLSDGSDLPGWLLFDGQVFSGTPTQTDIAELVIEVVATDQKGGTAEQTFNLTVGGVNDAPVSTNDGYIAYEGTDLVVEDLGVLSNDTDQDGDTLTAVLVDDVSHGSLTLNTDGSFTYTPNADFTGADSFTYKANDGTTDGNTVTVDIEVNNAVVANDDVIIPVIGGELSVSSPESTYDNVAPNLIVLPNGYIEVSYTNFNPEIFITPSNPFHNQNTFNNFLITERYNADGQHISSTSHTTSSYALAPATTPTADGVDGNFFAVWLSGGRDNLYSIAVGVVYSDYGSYLSYNLNTSGLSSGLWSPDVTTLSNGNYAVVWSTSNTVFGRIFSSDGSGEAAFSVNELTDGRQNGASVSALTDGGFVVTWTSDNPQQGDISSSGVKARIFNNAGEEIVSEFLINEHTNGEQRGANVTTLENGGFIVTWSSEDQRQGDDSDSAIKARIFNADGTEAVSEFLVNQITSGNQAGARATELADGRLIIVWTSNDNQQGDDSGYGVKARLFNADGTPAGEEFLVNETINYDQNAVSVGALLDGGFVISWQSDDSSPDYRYNPNVPSYYRRDEHDIKIRFYNADGTPRALPDEEGTEDVVTVLNVADILANDDGVDPTTFTVTEVSALSENGATVTLNNDGTISYDPTNAADIQALGTGETLTDTFSYIVSDGLGSTDSAVVSITVSGINDSPVAVNRTIEMSTLAGDLFAFQLSSDLFVDAEGHEIVGWDTSHWQFPNWLSYDPETHLLSGTPMESDIQSGGATRIVIQAIDSSGDRGYLTVNLNIENQAPIARDDDFGSYPNKPNLEDSLIRIESYDPLYNDSRVDGGAFSMTQIDDTSLFGAKVSLEDVPTSSIDNILYDPTDAPAIQALAEGETLVDTFSYTISDDLGASDTANILFTITGVNDAPVAGDALTNQTADEGSAFAYSLPVDAFSDVDGDELTLAATLDDDTELPNWLMFDPDTGAFSGTPGQDDVGELTVKVTATDPSGETAVQTFTLTIGTTNNALVVSAIDAGAVAENAEAQTIDLLAGQTDPENGTLSAINITVVDENNAPVQFTDKGDGTITIDPAQFADALNDGDTRNVTVSYDVSDGTDTTPNTATLVVTGADAPNTAPVAVNDVLRDVSDPVSEFLVNELTNHDQSRSSITALEGGGFVVTWTSRDQQQGDTSDTGVKARIFNADGTEAVSEFLVNEFTNDDQSGSSITALEGGGFVVTWWSSDPQQGDTSGAGVKARIFNADGTEAVSEFLVNELTNSTQYSPSITALEGGGFVVTWHSRFPQQGDTNGYGIKARIFNADGTEAVSEFLVNELTDHDQFSPAITALEGGGFVVTWWSHDPQQGDTSNSGVKARIFNADGTEAVSEFLVNELTNSHQHSPAITALAGGGFVVTWPSWDPQQGDTSDTGIKARIFNADGTEAVSEFLVNELTNDDQGFPSIAALEDGGFVVTWGSDDPQQGDTSSDGIKARIFNADGTEAVSEFLVNELTNDDQYFPAITALAGGGFVVTWTSSDPQQGDTSGAGVKARIFNADGTPRDISSPATDEDTALTIEAATLLANDTDADGDDLTITDVDATSANGANITLNNDGTISYNPTGSATIQALNDSDTLVDTFSYTISDGNGGTDTATVSITVVGADEAAAQTASNEIGPKVGSGALSAGDTPLEASGEFLLETTGEASLQIAPVSMNNSAGMRVVQEQNAFAQSSDPLTDDFGSVLDQWHINLDDGMLG